MGYCTTFTLTTEPETNFLEEELEEMSGGYYWEDEMSSYRLYDSKWYDHDKHMIAFSKNEKYKNVLFTIEGEGEEAGDLWKAYYKNGKTVHHQAILTFPEFKEEDLK